MTTNKRDSFDTVVEAALFRPGRIDLEVAFSRAPNLQIQQLFLALYQISQQPYKSPLAERTNKTSDAIHNAEPMDAQKLSQLAKQFSDKIPENMLSPAEIQGFLMRWKDNPRGACENVEKWTQEMKTAKKAGDWVSQDEPVTKPRRRGVLSMLGRKPRSALLQK
jgi:chaperone BCS1